MPRVVVTVSCLVFQDGQSSGTTDTVVVVGAASKGIIQRDHQHDAVVYKQYYASNPFDSMTEADVERYKAEVERRSRGRLQNSCCSPLVVRVVSGEVGRGYCLLFVLSFLSSPVYPCVLYQQSPPTPSIFAVLYSPPTTSDHS